MPPIVKGRCVESRPLESIFDSLPLGLYWLQALQGPGDLVHFRLNLVNSVGAALLGLTQEQARGRDLSALLRGPEQAYWHAACLRAWERQEPEEHTLPMHRSNLLPRRWFKLRLQRLAGGVLASAVERTGLHAVQRELEEAQEHLARTQSIAHIGSWTYDVNSGHEWWSQETYRIFGADPGAIQLDYNAFLGFVHPEDRQSLHEQVQATLGQGQPFSHEYRILRRDGQTRWLRSEGRVILDAQGQAMEHLGTVQDLTELRGREERISASEDLRQRVLDCTPIILFALDPQGMIRLSEGKGLARQGLKPEEVVGRSIFEVYHDAPDFLAHIRRSLAGESLVAVDATRGAVYERRLEPTRDTAGRVTGVIGVALDITDRHLAEQERERSLARLRHSEGQFRSLIEDSGQGVAIIGADLRFQFANRALAGLLGVESAQELIGAEVLPFIQPGREQRLRERLQEVVEQKGELRSGATTLRRRNGARLDVDFVSRRVEWSGGPAALYTLVDQTERTRAANELRSSRALMRRLVDSLPQGICVKDAQGRYLLANTSMARIHGMTTEEMEGRTAFDLAGIGQEQAERLTAEDQRILRGGHPAQPVQVTVAGEQPRQLLVSKFPMYDPGTDWVGIVGIAEDVTERTLIQRQLEQHRVLLQAIFDTLPARLLVTDRDAQPVLINKIQAQQAGLTPQDTLQADNAFAQKSPDQNREVWSQIRTVLAKGSTFDYERTRRVPDGREVHERIIRAPLFDSTGSVSGALNVAIDITRQKHTEDQLRHAQKMEAVGQLAGGVAHDFNNLLQIIQGFGDLARIKAGGNPDLLEVLDHVLHAAERAGDLTRQLLAFSRRQVLRPRSFDLKELVQNLMKMLQRLIGEQIEVTLRSPLDTAWVHADRGMIEQVIMNLCVNARDAMPEGGKLVVGTELATLDAGQSQARGLRGAGQFAVLTVADSGCGIAPEHQQHIFEPFFTTKPEGRGTGLGLSIVYGIVQQHGGHIGVQSIVGAGTTFSIYLPHREPTPAWEAPGTRPESRRGNEVILLAEDEEAVLNLLVNLLQSQGYQVIAARNGEEAIRLYQQEHERIQLVVLDVVMPKVGGKEAVERIHALDGRARVLLSTGYAANTLDADFLAQHRVQVLEKPFSPKELFRAVSDVLDRRDGPSGASRNTD